MGTPNSEKSFVTALVLCWFLGLLGIHRFYLGKSGTGIFMLLTLGGLGIWTIIDFVIIATGNFSDSNGLKIKMASKPNFCAQCGKPLADSLSTFCSECSAHTTGNVSGNVETQIEVTAEALRRVEKEKQTKKTKRVGIGCLVLIGLVILITVCSVFTDDASTTTDSRPGIPSVYAEIEAMTDCGELQTNVDISLTNAKAARARGNHTNAEIALSYSEAADDRMRAIGCYK